MDDGTEALDDKDGRDQVVAEALPQRLNADRHELLRFSFRSRCHVPYTTAINQLIISKSLGQLFVDLLTEKFNN